MFHNTYAGIRLGYLYHTASLLFILELSRMKSSDLRRPQWDEVLMTAAFLEGKALCLHCLCPFILFLVGLCLLESA